MKVGLLTYHFSDNYGALYQAYGLRQWFINQGHDAQFINYHPVYVEQGGALDRPWKLSLWRKNATIVYMQLSHIHRSLLGDKQQRAAFDAFRADHLGVSGDPIRSSEDICRTPGNFDVLVCGSDQIWNPSIQQGVDPVYFLDFPGSADTRKVAYAPSFGRTGIEACHLPKIAELVLKLDGVSVRETTGADILRAAGVARARVHVVPDPTILLGDFSSLIPKQTESNPAIFCYALRTDEVIREVAEQAAERLDLPVVSSRNSRQRWRDIGEGISPGPVEWLRHLVSSKFVVSNSFHGVALSMIHNKPFIAVKLPGKRQGMNARVENLLAQVGLLHRAVDCYDRGTVERLTKEPIDWSAVNAKLAELRSTGESYLQEQLAAPQRAVQ